MDITKGIREMMLNRNVKSGEVAKSVGYTNQSYSRMLKNGINKINVLVSIADSMGYDVNIVFRDRTGDNDIIIK